MSYKALIVEDNILFSQSLTRILKAAFPFMEIEETREGEEVLSRDKLRLPDLIFMDIQLPGINGLKLTKMIKKDSPWIVIIILTGHDLPEYRKAAKEAGADNFISKKTAKVEDIIKAIESTGLKSSL